MERPERPSRPEKPNRDNLRNSLRIRRRITSLLYGMRSPDSTTDSESEDVNNTASSSRGRSSSGRRVVSCTFSGGGGGSSLTDSQPPDSLLRHQSSPPPAPVTITPPSRSFLDVLRSEPVSSTNVIYTLQPFRSPQRSLPIPINHPLPMFHPSSSTNTASSFEPPPPATLCSNNGRFNLPMQMQPATSTSGALRDSQLADRDRPSMSGGASFLVCDDSTAPTPGPLSTAPPPKRFCPNASQRPLHSFSSLMRNNNRTLNCEDFPSTREYLQHRLALFSQIGHPRDEILPYSTVSGLSSNRNGGNSSFVASVESAAAAAAREDSGDGSDVAVNGRDEGTAGAATSPPPSPPPPRPTRPPRFYSVHNGSLVRDFDWVSPTRDNGNSNGGGSTSNRAAGRSQQSRSSLILRAVDELEEERMFQNNRRYLGFLDDEVLDEDLVPSSRPASDSDVEIDEDLVRTAVTNLELLRDGGGAAADNNGDNGSQADDNDEPASSPDLGQQLIGDQNDNEEPADMRMEQLNSDEEEVVLVSVNNAVEETAEEVEEDNSDANSATTEPAEDLSNDEPFHEAAASTSQPCTQAQCGEEGAAPLLKSLDAEEGQDFNAKLLALLECPVCLETIVPPIHQCRKGHPVCGVCRPRLVVCPTCRTRFTETRNLLMEKVADMMQFPCKNYVVGCTVSTALKDKNAHELGCGYRQYSCIDRDCQWKGFKQELLVHCNKFHASQVIFARESAYHSVVIPFELHRQTSFVLSALDEVFIVTLKVYPHNILRGCTVFLGPPENAKHYYYYFKFGNKSVNKSFKYREMTSAHKTSIHSNEFFQDTCFSYQFEPIFVKSHRGKIVVECKIAVTKPRQCSR